MGPPSGKLGTGDWLLYRFQYTNPKGPSAVWKLSSHHLGRWVIMHRDPSRTENLCLIYRHSGSQVPDPESLCPVTTEGLWGQNPQYPNTCLVHTMTLSPIFHSFNYKLSLFRASLVVQMVKESAYNAGDLGSISGSGRSLGGGHGYPLQYSCLGSPVDRGAWRATIHGVTGSQTWLSH